MVIVPCCQFTLAAVDYKNPSIFTMFLNVLNLNVLLLFHRKDYLSWKKLVLFYGVITLLQSHLRLPATLLKKRLWHRCFSVNFAKFLRTPFLQNTSGRLFLSKPTHPTKTSKWRFVFNMSMDAHPKVL